MSAVAYAPYRQPHRDIRNDSQRQAEKGRAMKIKSNIRAGQGADNTAEIHKHKRKGKN
jgi:hypothetical protein